MDQRHLPSAPGALSAGPACRTLPQALDAAALSQGGFHFHSGKGVLTETLSFRALREEALCLARRLLAAGLKRGDRVGIVADTDGDFPRLFFACQYACLVPVPLPLPTAFGGRDVYLAHLRQMIRQAGAAGAFAPEGLRDWLGKAAEGLGLTIAGSLADLPVATGAAGELPRALPGDLCYLQFSSGSTRFPAGVAVTQDALMANAAAIIRHGLQVVPGDRCVSWLPFYHDMGLVGFMLAPLIAGLDVDYLATRDFARRPLLWPDLIGRNGGTISYSPSFGYDLCSRRAAAAPPGDVDLSRWRIAGIGGDMIRPHILAEFAERFAPAGFSAKSFVASYGMAEAALALSFAPLGRGIETESVDRRRLGAEGRAAPAAEPALARAFVLCGPALPGHRLEVRGASGAALGDHRVGRIHASGPSLMQGYFGDPEATRAALSPDGWLDTGDLGYLADGQLVVTGRAKDLMIVNGRNIWPQDLEWTAESEVEGLRSGDVAVFSFDDGDEGEERVVALVECRLAAADSRAALAEAVAGSLRTRHGVAVEAVLVKPHALPTTSSGKLSRTKARELYRAMQADKAAVRA